MANHVVRLGPQGYFLDFSTDGDAELPPVDGRAPGGGRGTPGITLRRRRGEP